MTVFAVVSVTAVVIATVAAGVPATTVAAGIVPAVVGPFAGSVTAVI